MKRGLLTIRDHGNELMKWATPIRYRRAAIFLTLGIVLITAVARPAAAEEGIALAIVYDTSGSMKDSVPAQGGKYAPKYVIANKALGKIIDQISHFATNGPSGTTRKIETGLFVFRDVGASEAVKFGPFDPEGLRSWVTRFTAPQGATPLGNSIATAWKKVERSGLSHKHVVVLTDGMNTSGPKPEEVLPRLKAEAKQRNVDVSLHFLAFDVDAKVFAPVKKLGATIVGASNEEQLNAQLGFIFEKKILLEDEEPASPAPGKSK
jgi:hypothetical protein